MESVQLSSDSPLENLLDQVVECQVLALHILECPTNSKLIEVLE